MPLPIRSEEHTSELQSPCNLVCRLLLEKKKSTLPLTTPPRTGSAVFVRMVSVHLAFPYNSQRHFFFFFFKDPATTETSPLPLPDALPIYAEWFACTARKGRGRNLPALPAPTFD